MKFLIVCLGHLNCCPKESHGNATIGWSPQTNSKGLLINTIQVIKHREVELLPTQNHHSHVLLLQVRYFSIRSLPSELSGHHRRGSSRSNGEKRAKDTRRTKPSKTTEQSSFELTETETAAPKPR